MADCMGGICALCDTLTSDVGVDVTITLLYEG
eukprot:COSAG05_NODE_4857_length_1346_cov_1.342422_1_plen_31_part_10